MTSAATTFRVALQLWRHANDRVRVALLRKASCTGEKGGGRSPCLHGCGKTVTTQKLCLGATATAARMVLHGLQQGLHKPPTAAAAGTTSAGGRTNYGTVTRRCRAVDSIREREREKKRESSATC